MVYCRIPEHRKIVQYAFNPAYGDVFDSRGHGTKCAGSISGAVLSDDSYANSSTKLTLATGVAPAARLSVVDFNKRQENDSLYIPDTVDLDYLPVHTAAGAFITSDSWGSLLAGYSAKARGYDMFLWKNPDHLSLIAAGNYGLNSGYNSTITSPATAKNVVAVGAGYRVPKSEGIMAGVYVIRTIVSSVFTIERPFMLAENTELPLLASIIPNDSYVEVVAADPITACTPLNNVAQVAGRIVLVRRSSPCGPFDVGLNVIEAGGAAVIIAQATMDKPFVPPFLVDEIQSITIPVSMTYKNQADNLINFLQEESGQVFIRGTRVPLDAESLADFSSWGPTSPDGRIKPDIIAPGTSWQGGYSTTSGNGILSPLSSNAYGGIGGQCAFDCYSGTSAATPLAAGTVALMRQYLRTGFYPSGRLNSIFSTPFTPSGMLLKALLIAGSKSLESGVARATGKLLGPPPDGYQGWGRLSMSGSLPLEGFTDPRVRLQVLDRGQFTLPGQSVTVTGLVATGT
ncbi:hypothetical protein Vafri_12273, partial [Volvox africanus]